MLKSSHPLLVHWVDFGGVLLVDQMAMGRFQYVKLAVNVLDVATHRQRLLTEYRK